MDVGRDGLTDQPEDLEKLYRRGKTAIQGAAPKTRNGCGQVARGLAEAEDTALSERPSQRRGIRGDAGAPKRCLRNLRRQAEEWSPSRGPHPRHRPSSWPPLQPVQPGARAVQGRHRSVGDGNRIPEPRSRNGSMTFSDDDLK